MLKINLCEINLVEERIAKAARGKAASAWQRSFTSSQASETNVASQRKRSWRRRRSSAAGNPRNSAKLARKAGYSEAAAPRGS